MATSGAAAGCELASSGTTIGIGGGASTTDREGGAIAGAVLMALATGGVLVPERLAGGVLSPRNGKSGPLFGSYESEVDGLGAEL